MNKDFLAIATWKNSCKRPDIGLDILIRPKEGKIHLDFRNSLSKYALNKRRYKFVIIRITVD